MTRFWAGQPELARQLEEVKQRILLHAGTDDPGVAGAVRQLLASSGKMLRPAFVLLASRFGAPDPDRVVRVAAAVEMLHMATLVHDDIIDASPRRRGVPTLHTLRGPRAAVLVGDWLLASSVSLVADLGTTEDGRSLAQVVARICGSEIRQTGDKFAVDASVRRYRRRIAGKTAALFAVSFHVGATQAGCPTPLVSLLRRLGYCIGMSFQIIDDILDFAPEGANTGKPAGSDLAQGIYTLPVILTLAGDDGTFARLLARSRRSRWSRARAAQRVRQGSGIAAARAAAEVYTRRALAAIEQLPCAPARDVLRTVTEQLLKRTY